jgi:dTDP-4-amino-4,6-dideoxygalactose transaminase
MRLSQSCVGAAESAALCRVIEHGYLGMGAESIAFEAALADFLGVPAEHVAAVATGTAALHLACQAVCPRGSAVLVPSLTYVAAFQAITAAGCQPVPCEVLAPTCTLDYHDAAQRLAALRAHKANPPVSAIMPMTYAGNPYELDSLHHFAAQHGLRVLSDAAHAFGSKHKHRLVGSFGDITCFSFDGIKNITCGEGGAVVCSNAQDCQRIRTARQLGVQGDSAARAAGKRILDPEVEEQGWRYHLSNLHAAVGLVQLARLLPELAPKRKALAARYCQNLQDVPHCSLLHCHEQDDIVPHIFALRILTQQPALRDSLRQALAAAGIESGIHYKPCHLLARFGKGTPALPVTEMLYSQLISLPLHPNLSLEDVDQVCTILKTVLLRTH